MPRLGFDRPAWKELMAHVQRARGAVDQVLFVMWYRFSRDATGALSMIRRLEELGVRAHAIEQPLESLDEVPENLLMLKFYVAAPEVENRRRSKNTKAGMRRAMREGRYVNVPPKGYARATDAAGKYVIVPDPVQAPFVTEAFRLAADTDLSVSEIARRLRAEGFVCSKNQLGLLLRNPLYRGAIAIPAWGAEPYEEAAGIHAPLTDAVTFRRVQERFNPDKKRHVVSRFVPELPLRGHLISPPGFPRSGERLTGSRSRAVRRLLERARQGAFHARADEVHHAFAEHLCGVELSPEVAALYKAVAKEATEGGRPRGPGSAGRSGSGSRPSARS